MALAMSLFISLPALTIAQTSATTGIILQATLVTENAVGAVGEVFVLDGSKSVDDGTVKTYTWTQVSGPYKFRLASGAKVSITPPAAGTYVFELKATDRAGDSSVVKKVQLSVSVKNETTGGTADINIGVGEQQPGTALEQTGVEPDEIDFNGESEQATNFGVLLEGGSDEEAEAKSKGKVEVTWKVEEGEKLTPVFLELDGVPGESDEEAAARANDRLRTAGPVDGWPAGGVQIAVGDVNGLTNEQKQSFLATVKGWAEVKSEQDLQNFALGVMIHDDRPAETLSLNYEKIKFSHKVPSKFLGIFNSSLPAETEVDHQYRVKVKMPWYSFLFSKVVSAAELESEIDAKLAADTAQEDKRHKDWINVESVNFNAQAQALQTISNVLKTKHDTAKNSISNVR